MGCSFSLKRMIESGKVNLLDETLDIEMKGIEI